MIDLNGRLRLHDRFRSQVVRIGAEQVPVLVVDDFLSEPEALVDYAAAHGGFGPAAASYPGVSAPAPGIYSFALRAFLGPAVAEAFGLDGFKVGRERIDFSMITTPPERLAQVQRMPHIDNTSPDHFAVLHYLCAPAHGGTAFYRHRATGFETVDAGRFEAYKSAVEHDLAALGPPPAGYIAGDDAIFERIAGFDAVFNRVLVYRGHSLHSAEVGAEEGFDADPRRGRLTANAFFWVK
jgi:hypothetical protein